MSDSRGVRVNPLSIACVAILMIIPGAVMARDDGVASLPEFRGGHG